MLLETSAQRPEATQSNDTPQHSETPTYQDLQHDETPSEAISNDTKQHDATVKRGLFDRIDRGLKAFLK